MHGGTSLARAFRPLSDGDVVRVHHAALDLLATVGMGNPSARVRELALSQGCYLDPRGRLIFPKALVEDRLADAARRFVVHARDRRFDFEVSNDTLHFCTGGAAISMLDPDSGKYRPSTLRDLYDLSRLCDALENIQWFTRPVVATDIRDLYELDINTLYACMAGTRKHIATSITRGDHVHAALPLLDEAAGGTGAFARRPFCTVHATTVVSPMAFSTDSLDVACAAVDIGMPVHSQTGPQAGATAPAALAGTLAQGCAESLASLTVINMLKPAHPTVIGNWTFVSDLRTGAFSGGGAEQALLGAASGQMASFYGIPGGMGAGMTDSKIPDNQAGYEKAFSLMASALSGGGLVYESAGMLASLLGCAFEAMIIDDDMLSNLNRFVRGIEVSDETLSVGVIGDCVAGPGHFLGHRQTMDLMESEYVYPRQADRLTPVDWVRAGSLDSWQRAGARAREILSNHWPQYIDRAADRRIRDHYPVRLKPGRPPDETHD